MDNNYTGGDAAIFPQNSQEYAPNKRTFKKPSHFESPSSLLQTKKSKIDSGSPGMPVGASQCSPDAVVVPATIGGETEGSLQHSSGDVVVTPGLPTRDSTRSLWSHLAVVKSTCGKTVLSKDTENTSSSDGIFLGTTSPVTCMGIAGGEVRVCVTGSAYNRT